MQRPLRIAIVCDSVTDCLAGSFISTQRFSTLLKARGHTVVFITGRSPMNPHDGEFEGMKVYRFRSILLPKSEGQFYLSFPTPREIKTILLDERIDVVHTMIPTPSVMAATYVARAHSIPLVAHSHTQPDNVFHNMPRFIPTRTLMHLFYRYMHWIYGKAHAVIHPSEFSRQKFTRLTKPDSHVISNGVNAGFFSWRDPTPFIEKFKIPKDRQRIVFVGRIHPEKDIETAIRALPLILKKRPDVQLIIVGFGFVEASLERLAKKLDVQDHVTFTGRIDDTDLVMAYSAADLFVMPSLAELEGMAVLEAMATGAPILIADAPESAARLFVDGNGLLFKPRDHHDLAEKALRILADPELIKKMRAVSLERVKNYDINRSVERLEALYHSLV